MLLQSIPTIMMIVAPILITAIGGMICERSGVVNIALEGLMSIGACTAASVHCIMEAAGCGRYSIAVGLLAGMAVAGLISMIHGVAAIDLKADQTISGTGINLLADGITVFACQILFSQDRSREFKVGMLTDGLGFYPTFYIAIAVVLVSWFVLYKTPFGMHLRAPCRSRQCRHQRTPRALHRCSHFRRSCRSCRRMRRSHPDNPVHLFSYQRTRLHRPCSRCLRTVDTVGRHRCGPPFRRSSGPCRPFNELPGPQGTPFRGLQHPSLPRDPACPRHLLRT